MLDIRAGQRLVLAIGEAVTASLPMYDATGEKWPVATCAASIGDLMLETSVVDGIPRAVVLPLASLGASVLEWHLTGSDATQREVHTDIEVVGAHLCAIADIRSYNRGADVDGFADKVRYPDDVVFDARQRATDAIESACGRAFSPRRRKQTVLKPAPVIALDECDVSFVDPTVGAATLVSDCQVRIDRCMWMDYPIELTYDYGLPYVPEEVRAATVRLAANYLRPLNRPEAATGESTDLGYISYTLAGRDGATGLPEVDAVIGRYKRSRYEVM